MEFLNIVAADIMRRIGSGQHGQMKDLTIVFPNKRASLFFNQYLAADNQLPMWAPRYTTISELFQSMTDITVADPTLLVFLLYKAYIAETVEHETFDHFYSWGEVLLSDFDDIDSAMVDADALFRSIADLEGLTRFDYIDAEQQEAIRKLFSSFSLPNVTQLQERYLQMWKAMPRIYRRFRQMLEERGYAYPGMMKRHVAEHLASLANKLPEGPYAVVGFNVLSQSERQLFLHLKHERNAWFYWDYDETFTSNPNSEAGIYINDNIHLLGNSLESHPELFRNMSKQKDINIVSASTDSAQASYVGKWLTPILADRGPLTDTAIVLCDENLLPSVLHSIPPTLPDGTPTQLNITMGYPLQETPATSFAMAILELMFRAWRPKESGTPTEPAIGRWRFSYAQRVLQHPFTLAMAPDAIHSIIEQCRKQNLTYPPATLFESDPFIANIFQAPHDDILVNLSRLNQTLQTVAATLSAKGEDGSTNNEEGSAEGEEGSTKGEEGSTEGEEGNARGEEKSTKNEGGTAKDNTLHIESLYTASTVVTRFMTLIHDEGLTFDSPDTLIRLMRQALASRTIAFHGQPAVGLQLMGILETRNLDFSNIIMLSAGEGTLPKQAPRPSFILNFLREAHGMSTPRRTEALYAYYFYRLIARANHISLLYSSSTDGLHRGEMSRLLMQLTYDSKAIGLASQPSRAALVSPIVLNDGHTTIDGGQTIDNGLQTTNNGGQTTIEGGQTIDNGGQTTNEEGRQIEIYNIGKTMPALPKGALPQTFSPTALNTYIDCPRRFYLQYVCHFRDDDSALSLSDGDVADNLFGSIYHNAMQRFYTPRMGRELTPADFAWLTPYTLRRLVDQAFAKEMFHYEEPDIQADRYAMTLSGNALLVHEVISRYVERTVKGDATQQPLTILTAERPVDFSTPLPHLSRMVNIGGVIDREDLTEIEGKTVHRVVDYKTSVRAQAAESIESLFDPTVPRRSSHIFQILLYCEALYGQPQKPEHPLMPCLLYVKQGIQPTPQAVNIGGCAVSDYFEQCHDIFALHLRRLLENINDTDNEFEAISSDTHCPYCPFRSLCQG